MAIAKAIDTTKTVLVRQKGVELTLTPEEARALYLLFKRIGGNPQSTARGYIENITKAMYHALGDDAIIDVETEDLFDKRSASLYFTDASRAVVEQV